MLECGGGKWQVLKQEWLSLLLRCDVGYYIRRVGVDDKAAQIAIGRMAGFTIKQDVGSVVVMRVGGEGIGGISSLLMVEESRVVRAERLGISCWALWNNEGGLGSFCRLSPQS